MQNEWVEAGGFRLQVRRWGSDGGPRLLFLHSLGPAASGALLGPGVGPLVDAGWSIAAPDMPGFGESPPLELDGYTAANLGSLAWRLADGLGWQDVVLSGHSWGGSVAVHAAAAQPERVRALVLVDSGHLDYGDQPGGPGLSETFEELVEKMEAARVRPRNRAQVASDLELPPDDPVVDAYMAGLMDDDDGGLVSRTLGTSRAKALYQLMRARQSDMWAALASARFPILLLLASKPDELRSTNEAAAARFSAAIPRADIRFLDATHSLITDLRDDFGTTVRDWLASID